MAVHSKNCPNVQNLLYDAARKIEVEWAGVAPQAEAYAVPLTILSENRTGILAQIAAVVAEVGSNIVHVEAKTVDERGTIDLPFAILKKELDDIVTLNEDELAEGVRLALRATHNLAEGAGAAPLMAAMKLRARLAR